jgi:hypothetical protein
MKLRKLLVLCFVLSSVAFAESHISNLLEIRPGEIYVQPAESEMIFDKERPTTQFESPNQGSTKAAFPTYELALINDSGAIAIATATSPCQDLAQCQTKLESISKIMAETYKGFVRTPASMSQLGGSNEYSMVEHDIYYVLECNKEYGPFWTLHLQIRSKAQDKLLKQAWEQYFESRS